MQISDNQTPDFDKVVEEEANTYFRKIYRNEISIEESIALLKQFKNSTIQRERDLFVCMINNLFDEYRFFHTYPDKYLRTTAILFGSIINQNLIISITLGMALRYVLQALRKPQNPKMFQFGVIALDIFKGRLIEWPQYCAALKEIPQLAQSAPELMKIIDQSLSAATPGERGQYEPSTDMEKGKAEITKALEASLRKLDPSQIQQSSSVSPATGLLGAVGGNVSAILTSASNNNNINNNNSTLNNPLLAAPIASAISKAATTPPQPFSTPPKNTAAAAKPFGSLANTEILMSSMRQPAPVDEATQDKIHFIINNLSQANIEQKAAEMKEFLQDAQHEYLAFYLVVRRASMEPNFHAIYVRFLDLLAKKALSKLVIDFTYDAIKVLLKSESIQASFSERTLLKHLGSWLGSLTLAKNRPVLHKDLDLKELLFDAYERGRLIAIVPFVAKVLDTCSRSKIFRPPNPYVMALINVLVEIHHVPDLKLNLKFEVEVLCKSLNLKVTEIETRGVLRSKVLAKQPNPDLNMQAQQQQLQAVAASNGLPLQSAGGLVRTPESVAKPQQPPGLGMAIPSIDALVDAQAFGDLKEQAGQAQAQAQQASMSPLDQPIVIQNLDKMVTINPQLALFSQFPQLKKAVALAVDRAILEIIQPVVERSVNIACIATRELVIKDFAIETDEQKVLRAANLMVKNLAGNLAMVTCKEPLRVSIGNQLRNILQATLGAVQASIDLQIIEQAINFVCHENVDLGCAFIQKAAKDKAASDIEEPLRQAFQAQVVLRESTGQPFQNAGVTRFVSMLPDMLKPKVGGLGAAQQRVYDDFAQTVSPAMQQTSAGFGAEGELLATGTSSTTVTAAPAVSVAPEEALQIKNHVKTVFEELTKQLITLQKERVENIASLPANHDILNILRSVISMIKQLVGSSKETTIEIAQLAFAKLFEYDGQLFADSFVAILESLREIHADLARDITTWITFLDDDRKFLKPIVLLLIKANLTKTDDIDTHIAQLVSTGNRAALNFSVHMLRRCVIENHFTPSLPQQFFKTLDVLAQYSKAPDAPEGLAAIVEESKRVYHESGVLEDKLLEFKLDDKEAETDISDLKEKVAVLFQEWLAITSQPTQEDVKIKAAFISKLQKAGLLKGDETTDKYFRANTEFCVESFVLLQQQSQQIQLQIQQLQQAAAVAAATAAAQPDGAAANNASATSASSIAAAISAAASSMPNVFQGVDAFSELIMTILKMLPEQRRYNLIFKVLSVVSKALLRENRSKRGKFAQRPFFRFFSNLLVDLNSACDPNTDTHFQILSAFSNMLHALQPSALPGFGFAWLELISHRMFMPKLLFSKFQKGWPSFQRLLVDLFKFLEPYLRNAELNGPVRLLYRGTLKILLVLLHDFPEFLCEYHFGFCDVIPPTCIQMRNLILSAFPRHMRLPDPFTPNLKVDLLPEINQPPRILSKFTSALEASGIKEDLDFYLRNRAPMSFLSELKGKLLLSSSPAAASAASSSPAAGAATASGSSSSGSIYNISLINSLVLHIGVHSLNQYQNKLLQAPTPVVNSPAMDIFRKLVMDLDSEGRYLFLNALANQLRYPNNHTHYFSCVLLFLFAEVRISADSEAIQEQITRVLLERLIVNRPHPWGLLITFIELVKNPRYLFWKHKFIHCAPEIEKLFDNVCRSCVGMVPNSKSEQELVM